MLKCMKSQSAMESVKLHGMYTAGLVDHMTTTGSPEKIALELAKEISLVNLNPFDAQSCLHCLCMSQNERTTLTRV